MSHRRWLAAATLLLAISAVSSTAGAEQHANHQTITIAGNKQFTKANGVRSGLGTTTKPYLIFGWEIDNLTIKNTSKAVRIVGNTINGTLTLNFAGGRVDVIDNDVSQLRVNENIPRYAPPTSGMIMRNRIGVVSQIRHFDGRFAYNTVGYEQPDNAWSSLPFTGSPQAVNFDGFNGSRFDHNTVFGTVDVRLHGHHHSSGFGKESHMHSAAHDHHDMVDHTRRYHQVLVDSNTIHAFGDHALSYTDTNHSGNDRTAASETSTALNKPHVHHTKVAFLNNKLVGAGILVNVFNAADTKHKSIAHGTMDIVGNSIALKGMQVPVLTNKSGINVANARHLDLRIAKNSVTAPKPDVDTAQTDARMKQGAGVWLQTIQDAKVTIDGLNVTNRQYGVFASHMTRTTRWTISGLRTQGVQQRVYYDDSVANAPKVS